MSSEDYETTAATPDGGVVTPADAFDPTPDVRRDTGTYLDGQPVTPTPTQVEHPWRASLRTALFVVVPLLVLVVGIVPEVIQIILEETVRAGVVLPEWVRPALLGLSAATTAIAAILNRIALLPRANELLTALRIGPKPPAEG